jgi:hypothetical protein
VDGGDICTGSCTGFGGGGGGTDTGFVVTGVVGMLEVFVLVVLPVSVVVLIPVWW